MLYDNVGWIIFLKGQIDSDSSASFLHWELSLWEGDFAFVFPQHPGFKQMVFTVREIMQVKIYTFKKNKNILRL